MCFYVCVSHREEKTREREKRARKSKLAREREKSERKSKLAREREKQGVHAEKLLFSSDLYSVWSSVWLKRLKLDNALVLM